MKRSGQKKLVLGVWQSREKSYTIRMKKDREMRYESGDIFINHTTLLHDNTRIQLEIRSNRRRSENGSFKPKPEIRSLYNNSYTIKYLSTQLRLRPQWDFRSFGIESMWSLWDCIFDESDNISKEENCKVWKTVGFVCQHHKTLSMVL